MRSICIFLALFFKAALGASYTPSDAKQWAVTWLSPSSAPGKTEGGKSTYQDGMPLGNGRTTVLAWANVTTGGIGFWIGNQDAMSSNTDLFKLALLQVSLSPNPFTQGTFFNQTLDVSTATITIHAGGTGLGDYAVLLTAYVDANSDTLMLTTASRDPTHLYSLSATLSSSRPPGVWQYKEGFADCAPVFSNPDVALDPLPTAPFHLARPPPQSTADKFRHATGAQRPQRTLSSLPPTAAFQPNSLVWYHRNAPEDGLTINTTLTLQHIPQLIATTPDFWQDLTFGLALDGGAPGGGGGGALQRISNTTLASAAPAAAFTLRATLLVVQTDTMGEWLADLAAVVAAGDATPSGTQRALHEAYWGGYWGRSWIVVDPNTVPTKDAGNLNPMYAITRYTQAVQSRNTKWPIKFNGGAFVAAMGSNGEAEERDWGASNWWQNTRLPYGSMLASGDFDTFKVILDYMANQEILLGQRTLAYWNHTGMWTTETTHLSGAYDNTDYGCSRGEGWPDWLMQSGYLHVDQGGDSGTGEYPLMALDFLLYTGDAGAAAPYLKIAFQAANYLMNHYNTSADGSKVVVYPAQVLETWWCDWDTATQNFSNCCSDDSPTISGMMTLFEKLLALPPTLTTPQQRAQWAAFQPLIPDLPLTSGPGAPTIAPARILSSGSHNHEGPELYALHPHRVFTKGKEVATGFDITLGRATFNSSAFARANSGWNYGLNAAALIGASEEAAAMMLERSNSLPAKGYRWPGFAPHNQDFDPSADYFANMNRCYQDMLIQSGEDGFTSTSIVLFPAWPCDYDVSFKLWGPLNTSVEVVYQGGKVVSLSVDPPSRASSIKYGNCV